jgi:hypothetical protein
MEITAAKLIDKYAQALINGSCDIASFEKVLLYYMGSSELLKIKETLLAENDLDLNS